MMKRECKKIEQLSRNGSSARTNVRLGFTQKHGVFQRFNRECQFGPTLALKAPETVAANDGGRTLRERNVE